MIADTGLTLHPATSARTGVVITGGSGSIGRVLVDSFVAKGARVAVWDRKSPSGSSVPHRGVVYQEVDVGDPTEVHAAISLASDCLGTIDALVHCAGVLGPIGPLENSTWTELDKVLSSNLGGAILCSQAVIPHMKQQGTGCIVFISSIAAHAGSATAPAYAAAKGGLAALARSLAKQLGRHQIRVNCVSPGSVRGSELGRNSGAPSPTMAEVAGLLARVPLARLVQPIDVARAVLFLCSDAGAAITGIDLVVDGGEVVRMD